MQGLLANVFKILAQEVKCQLTDRLRPSVRRGHLRGEFDAPRGLCRKPSRRGNEQQSKNDYGIANAQFHFHGAPGEVYSAVVRLGMFPDSQVSV